MPASASDVRRHGWRAVLSCVALCAAAALLAPLPAHAARPSKGSRAAKSARSARALRAAKSARRRSAGGHANGVTLRGSRAAVNNAYERAREDGLPFARSRVEIERRARVGEYVPLARSARAYRLRGVAVPYVRPATRDFVASFGADYRRHCGEPLTVTSAMRPTSMHLANSVQKTVHPTGMAVDLRAPQRAGCRSWMRSALLGLERQGVVNATEEHRPAHFHVVVYRAP